MIARPFVLCARELQCRSGMDGVLNLGDLMIMTTGLIDIEALDLFLFLLSVRCVWLVGWLVECGSLPSRVNSRC